MRIKSENGVIFERHSNPREGYTVWIPGYDACKWNTCRIDGYVESERLLYIVLEPPGKEPLELPRKQGYRSRGDTLVHVQVSLASIEESYEASMQPRDINIPGIQVAVDHEGRLRLNIPRM
jgi:hypothetical protein